MNFAQTGLPERSLFHMAFEAGWEKFRIMFSHDLAGAEARYLAGPVAMARLVLERGGDCRQVPAAACLAGPAVFCRYPDQRFDSRVLDFAQQIMKLEISEGKILPSAVAGLSPDAHLFLQVSAVMLLNQLVGEPAGKDAEVSSSALDKSYEEALCLYSAARGAQDAFRLDTVFLIAAMKVTTVLDGNYKQPHLWVRSQRVRSQTAVAARPSLGHRPEMSFQKDGFGLAAQVN
jgi:hypothetical protein